MAFEIVNYQWLVDYIKRFLNRYAHLGQVSLYHYLNNIAQVCDAYFSIRTISSWVIAFILIWSVIYVAFARITLVILKCMSLPPLYRSRMIDSLWSSGFSISCICLCVMKLAMHESEATQALNVMIDYEAYFIVEEVIPAHMLFTCVVIFTFFIHSVILSCIQKGLETEFFRKGLFITVLYATYSLRYVWLGLSITILISTCTLCVELMKVFYSLNRGKSARSNCLQNFTCVLFAIHCILWGGTFLYVFPNYYLLPAINIRVTNEKVTLLILLAVALWGYFWLEVFYSPAFKLIWFYMRPDYSYGRRDWLDYVLFPPRNDVIEHLKRIRSKARLEQAISFQCDYYCRESSGKTNGVKNRNSAALFQTVKCVMAMKRRIRKKRQAKTLSASSQNISNIRVNENTSNLISSVNGFVSIDNSDSENFKDILSAENVLANGNETRDVSNNIVDHPESRSSDSSSNNKNQ